MNTTTKIALAAITALSTTAIAGDKGEGETLYDANASASFDNSTGQYSWTIDGVEHLYAQEFYFRRSGFNDEMNINTMTLLGQSLSDTNPFTDDNYDTINTSYSDGNGLEIETLFTLRGGNEGSGSSSITEQVSITNTSTSTIFISFFQYVDFDLDNSAFGDSGVILDGNIAQQWSDDASVSETVVTPAPDLFEIGYQGDIVEYWENGVIDNLSGNDSISDDDVAWAFQWNITLEAGDSFLISKNKTIVPTPGSLALLAAAGLVSSRRRRS